MFKTSLDSILSSFTKVSKQLDKFIDDSETKHYELIADIDALIQQKIAVINDKERAARIKNNLTKLLGE